MKPINLLSTKTSIFRIGLALLLAAGGQTAFADSATWTGLGANSAWTNLLDWSGSPVTVPGAGDTATFNGGGNSKTTITNAPGSLSSMIFDSASCAAYTITGPSTTWIVPDGGGVTVNSTVTTAQDLSGIQYVRSAGNATFNVTNLGSGKLTLGTLFGSTESPANLRVNLVPGANSTIVIGSGKLVNNGAANRSTSLLVNGPGILQMSGAGNYSGPDAEGNGLTIHQGTFSAPTLNLVGGYLPAGYGRIQFGETGTNRTATLQMTGSGTSTDGQAIYIIDGNTASFDITNSAGNLIISSNITESASTAGGGNLTKVGAGMLTFAGTNLYSGVTLVSAGTLYLSNNFALTNSTFDPSGAGTLVLDPTATTPTFGGLTGAASLTLSTNVTALTLNPVSGKTAIYSGTLNGGTNSSMSLIKIGAGRQTLSGSNAFTGNVTINAGVLRLANSYALGTAHQGLTMEGASRVLELSSGITLGANIDLNLSSNSGDGQGVLNTDGDNQIQGHINFSSGNPALNISSTAGTLWISGNLNMSVTARPLLLGGASTGSNQITGPITETISGALSVIKQGVGTWTLAGTNTYLGPTTINGGILNITGSLASTNVTLNAGTLSGTGVLNGPLVVNNGGILSPGVSTNLGESLTINNNLTLAGTALMQIGKSGATPVNDSVVGVTNITYGGTLIVTNATGATIVAGDAFVLFSASGTNSGNFTNIVVQPTIAGLTSSFNPTNGTLTFSSTAVASPTLNFTNLGGGSLQFSWTGSYKLQSQTNTLSTGLSTISSDWGDYPGGGSSPVSVTVDPAQDSVFFRLAPRP